ncbi:MAG: hypothetical protein A4E66_02666 [Syntrophus sp. PtaB.Bin001]|nr:MAG: hypothetical protein A4E66_02666 [Syntrophus sp. PtaB.Bin001]
MPRLHLGKVKNVVDNMEEIFSSGSEDFHISMLFGRKRRFQKKLGHADNGMHRRSDFMTHAGEKIALCQVCRFSFFLGLEEFLFSLDMEIVAEFVDGAAQAGIEVLKSAEQGIAFQFLYKNREQNGSIDFKSLLNFRKRETALQPQFADSGDKGVHFGKILVNHRGEVRFTGLRCRGYKLFKRATGVTVADLGMKALRPLQSH